MFHVNVSTDVFTALDDVLPFVADLSAIAGNVAMQMMSSRAGNRNTLSFAPQFHNYRTILTAPQQKWNRRESFARIRFS